MYVCLYTYVYDIYDDYIYMHIALYFVQGCFSDCVDNGEGRGGERLIEFAVGVDLIGQSLRVIGELLLLILLLLLLLLMTSR